MVFGKDYPMIETFQLGKHENFIIDMAREGMLDHPMQHEMAFSTVKHATKQYIRGRSGFYVDQRLFCFLTSSFFIITTVFRETQQAIKERKVDLVISDSFALACADAAIHMEVPVVLTSTFNTYSGWNT
jgi:hypothetical protein